MNRFSISCLGPMIQLSWIFNLQLSLQPNTAFGPILTILGMILTITVEDFEAFQMRSIASKILIICQGEIDLLSCCRSRATRCLKSYDLLIKNINLLLLEIYDSELTFNDLLYNFYFFKWIFSTTLSMMIKWNLVGFIHTNSCTGIAKWINKQSTSELATIVCRITF